MQSGLSVEYDDIIILHVSLYLVAHLKVKVTGLGVIPQVYSVSVISDNIFSAGVLGVAPRNQLLQLFQIKWSHYLREGHVLCNRAGHPHL